MVEMCDSYFIQYTASYYKLVFSLVQCVKDNKSTYPQLKLTLQNVIYNFSEYVFLMFATR